MNVFDYLETKQLVEFAQICIVFDWVMGGCF